jgi:hypothetical protein
MQQIETCTEKRVRYAFQELPLTNLSCALILKWLGHDSYPEE